MRVPWLVAPCVLGAHLGLVEATRPEFGFRVQRQSNSNSLTGSLTVANRACWPLFLETELTARDMMYTKSRVSQLDLLVVLLDASKPLLLSASGTKTIAIAEARGASPGELKGRVSTSCKRQDARVEFSWRPIWFAPWYRVRREIVLADIIN